jgi:hypothetical protein
MKFNKNKVTKQTLAELYTMSGDKTGRLPLVLDSRCWNASNAYQKS